MNPDSPQKGMPSSSSGKDSESEFSNTDWNLSKETKAGGGSQAAITGSSVGNVPRFRFVLRDYGSVPLGGSFGYLHLAIDRTVSIVDNPSFGCLYATTSRSIVTGTSVAIACAVSVVTIGVDVGCPVVIVGQLIE